MPDKVSLVVQAGGNSRRMGEDKALKLFLGRPLIQRVVERLASIADETLVTTHRLQEYAFLGLRLVPDLVPGRGALGGLYTALACASHPIVAVVACDLPFASALLFKTAIDLLGREEADVAIPRSTEGLEPLHAVYQRSTCLAPVLAALQADRFKVIDWFPSVRVRELSREEVAAADPSGRIFQNINTPADFSLAEEMARSELDQ
jgi:molybdopterin-guanine dinucleotide biosynthesis protein A